MDIDFSPAIDKIEAMLAGFIEHIPNMIVALCVFALFYLLSLVTKGIVRQFAKRANLLPNARLVLVRLSRAVIILIGLLVAFPILFDEFTAGQSLEILGIGGVAIGFAFRDILQNFLAGILILITQPFKLGDQIVIGEYEGTVHDILTRATLIKTYDGRLVVIPNADLFTQSVIVNTAFDLRRTHYDIGIGYGDDIALASKLMIEAMHSVEEVIAQPEPEALIEGLADSSVILRARWWTDSYRGEVIQVKSKVISAIKEQLVAHGIDLPFPTQQILFHDQTEETDGDRRLQREGWPARPDEKIKPRWMVSAVDEG